MNTVLVVNSSPRSQSVSRQIARHFAERWLAANPGDRIIERDVAAEPLPFLTESWVEASRMPAGQYTQEHRQELELSDKLIDEVMAADVIVLGVPMHNFSIPASLKAWFDLVARSGKTFSYGANGPRGLVPSEKKAVLVVSRGGVYGEGSPVDFQVPYLRAMLKFIGLTEVTVIEADRQGMGAELASESLGHALEKVSTFVEEYDWQRRAATQKGAQPAITAVA